MGKPAVWDFTWVRGTTKPPLQVRITQNGDPVPFEEVRLSVWNNNGNSLAFRASYLANEIVYDSGTNTLSFTPTAEQTRSLTRTKNDGDPAKNKYELELRQGTTERVWLMGDITAIGGLNDDEGDD